VDRIADDQTTSRLVAEHARLMAKMAVHGTRLSVQVERLERVVEKLTQGDDDERP
jgi:hypothetical protein